MTRSVVSLSLLFVLAAGIGVLAHLPWSPVETQARLAAESQGSGGAQIEPFTINVPDSVLMDLKERLVRTRMPDEPDGVGWMLGTNQAYLKQLVDYWRDEFDWRAQERRLNRFEQFKATIDGVDIHFIHQRSEEPGAFPLILTHGWPGTFAEFAKVIGPLTDPVSHGGRAEDAFHVVVPSIPGYGFSERPRQLGYRERTPGDFRGADGASRIRAVRSAGAEIWARGLVDSWRPIGQNMLPACTSTCAVLTRPIRRTPRPACPPLKSH